MSGTFKFYLSILLAIFGWCSYYIFFTDIYTFSPKGTVIRIDIIEGKSSMLYGLILWIWGGLAISLSIGVGLLVSCHLDKWMSYLTLNIHKFHDFLNKYL